MKNSKIHKPWPRNAASSTKQKQEQARKGAPEPNKKENWQILGQLFPPLKREVRKTLELFHEILQKVRPLNEKHLQQLPEDIRDLSHQLTDKRSSSSLPYWSSQASISAYLYYFLPWNIIRLGRLSTGLKLPDPAKFSKPLLLDAGSGPLTLPLALWIAKPEWRKLPIQVIAIDSSHQVLEIGKRIFSGLAEIAGENPWHVSIAACPVERLATHLGNTAIAGVSPWLLGCANVLNELAYRSKTKHKGDTLDKDDGNFQEANLYERLLEAWRPIWNESGTVSLFVEPGTRHGGSAIMNLRKAALAKGLHALSPCTHDGNCPLLETGRNKSSYTSGWCHFTFLTDDTPVWLKRLTLRAGLEKHSLSLSLLLLGKRPERRLAENLPARVLSQPFQVQGMAGPGRYGCTSHGIGLLENSACLPSGCLTSASQTGRKDKKHGYEILRPGTKDESIGIDCQKDT